MKAHSPARNSINKQSGETTFQHYNTVALGGTGVSQNECKVIYSTNVSSRENNPEWMFESNNGSTKQRKQQIAQQLQKYVKGLGKKIDVASFK
jgi:predicted transcriptional regulator